jgi:hypothetical protein
MRILAVQLDYREHLTERGLIRERRNPNALRAVLWRGRTSDLTWSASPGERWETSSRTPALIRPDQRGARFS